MANRLFIDRRFSPSQTSVQEAAPLTWPRVGKKTTKKLYHKKQTNQWGPCDSKGTWGRAGWWWLVRWDGIRLTADWCSDSATLLPTSFPETASTWTSSGDLSIFRCAALWLTAIWSDWSFSDGCFTSRLEKLRLQQQIRNNWFVVCVLLGFFAHSILLLLLLQNVINFVFPSSSLLPRCRPLCLTDFFCSRHSAPNVFQLLALERSKKKRRKKVKLSAGVFCREERGRTRRIAFDSLRFWKYLRKIGDSVLNVKAARPALISAERNEDVDKKVFNQKSLGESLKLGPGTDWKRTQFDVFRLFHCRSRC